MSAKWVHMPTSPVPEPLGRRVAGHRARLGLTQQELAARLALSRNAVSHIETGDSIPGERTIVLLAGLFGVEPHELVSGTDYPDAKTDRLPLVAARHTEVAARLLALDAELRWVALLGDPARVDALETLDRELHAVERVALEPAEHAAVRDARARLRALRTSTVDETAASA
jgi:transcriptional regulator with XRE-family HTH domain